MTPKPKITLYVDLHSPYTYLAYYYLRHSPTFSTFSTCEIIYTPVLMIGFIKPVGVVPPWDSPNKVNYMRDDLARWCRLYNIPWKAGLPENYPRKLTTLKVQRALAALSILSPEQLTSVLDRLFHIFWVEKKGIQLPEVFQPIFTQLLGEKIAGEVIELSESEKGKDILRRNTDEAIESGAPGLPWMIAEDRKGEKARVWGFDHLGVLAEFLGLDRRELVSHL